MKNRIKNIYSLLVVLSFLAALNPVYGNQARIKEIRAEIAQLKSRLSELKGIRDYIYNKINDNKLTAEGKAVSQPAPAGEQVSADSHSWPSFGLPPKIKNIPVPKEKEVKTEETDGVGESQGTEVAIEDKQLISPEDAEKQEIIKQIELISKWGKEDEEYWDGKEINDYERLELAKQLRAPDDIDQVENQIEQEKEKIEQELENARKHAEETGDYYKFDILKKQKEIKEEVIEELQLHEKVCSFNRKGAEEQNKELLNLKEAEKEAHKELVQQNAALREKEKAIKEKQDNWMSSWFGAGGPTEEELKELEEQKKKTKEAREKFVKLNEELLVKAGNAEKVDENIRNEVIDHGTKRLLAQRNVLEGKKRKLGLEEEKIDREKAQQQAAKGVNPVLVLAVSAKSSADKELMGQDAKREEDKLLKQAEIIKKTSEARNKKIAEKKVQIQKKVDKGELSESEARNEIMKLENQAKDASARRVIAEIIEEESVEIADKEEQKSCISGLKSVWEEDSPNTKTSMAHKPVKLIEAGTGDAVTATADKIKNIAGGAFGETKNQVVNQDIEKTFNNNSKSIRSITEYTELNSIQKEEIRQKEVFGREIKDKKAREVAKKLEESYLKGAGGAGVDLLNAGHSPKNEKEAMQISLAKAKRNIDKTQTQIKQNLEAAQIDHKTGESTSWNPIKWGTAKLTEHEVEKKRSYLQKLKKDKEFVEQLQYENELDVADEKDKNLFLHTMSEGLALKAEKTRKEYNKKIQKIDRQIEKTFPGEDRDKLRKQKQKLITEAAQKYKTYRHQGIHLEAERDIVQEKYQSAKAKYRKIAQEDPDKARQLKAMERTLDEHILTKKNNEMSSELAETVTTDVAVTVFTGGAGKAIKGAKTTLGKVKAGMKAYGRALNPVSDADEIVTGAVTDIASENIAGELGADKKTISTIITNGRLVKSKLKSQRLAYKASSTKPKGKFDTDIMTGARKEFTRQNLSKKVHKQVASVNKLAGRNLHQPLKIHSTKRHIIREKPERQSVPGHSTGTVSHAKRPVELNYVSIKRKKKRIKPNGRPVKTKFKTQRLPYKTSSSGRKNRTGTDKMAEDWKKNKKDKLVKGVERKTSETEKLKVKKGEVEKALRSDKKEDIIKLYRNGGMKEMTKLERAGQLSKQQADKLNTVISREVSEAVSTATHEAIGKTQNSTGVKIRKVMVGDSGSSGGVSKGRSVNTDADRTFIVEFDEVDLKKYADKHHDGNITRAEEILQKRFTAEQKQTTENILSAYELSSNDVGYEAYSGMGTSAGPSDSYPAGFVKTRQAVQGQTTVYNVKSDGRITSYKTSGEAMTDAQALKMAKSGDMSVFDSVKITPRDAEGMLVQQLTALKKKDCSAEKAAKALLRASKAGKILGRGDADPELLKQARALRGKNPQAALKSMSLKEQQEFVRRVKKTVQRLSR